MEKQLNSSGKISQDFHHCLFFKRSKKDLARKNIQPEEFKDRIIFMSMFNDIDRKKNDENCISNAERVKNYAMKFSQGRWTFLGPGSEEKWYGSSVEFFSQQNGTAIQRNWSPCIQMSTNTELLFQTIHSVNQLSIYGAVANWCQHFGLTEEEKGRANPSVDKRMLTYTPPEEAQLLVSPPTVAPGIRMRENVLSFENCPVEFSSHSYVKNLLVVSCDSREEV